jgi:hypothetical protein
MSDSESTLDRARFHTSHEEYVEQRSRYVVETVRQAENGTVGLLLAVREINAALHELPELEKKVREADFLFLTGVSSECDGLPLGTERQYWAPDSLREKDAQAARYAARIRDDVLLALARIADDLKQLQ